MRVRPLELMAKHAHPLRKGSVGLAQTRERIEVILMSEGNMYVSFSRYHIGLAQIFAKAEQNSGHGL